MAGVPYKHLGKTAGGGQAFLFDHGGRRHFLSLNPPKRRQDPDASENCLMDVWISSENYRDSSPLDEAQPHNTGSGKECFMCELFYPRLQGSRPQMFRLGNAVPALFEKHLSELLQILGEGTAHERIELIGQFEEELAKARGVDRALRAKAREAKQAVEAQRAAGGPIPGKDLKDGQLVRYHPDRRHGLAEEFAQTTFRVAKRTPRCRKFQLVAQDGRLQGYRYKGTVGAYYMLANSEAERHREHF